MSPFDALTLFAVMSALAVLPSSSVLLVISHTIQHGKSSGYWAVAGIVAGDLLLLGVAIYGLTEISNRFELAFSVLRGAGAAYLVWTGWLLLGSSRHALQTSPIPQGSQTQETSRTPQSRQSSFETGHASRLEAKGDTLLTRAPKAPAVSAFAGAMALTLGDIKALVFYASLLPGLLNLQTLSAIDGAILLLTVLIAVGGVKCVYVQFAQQVSQSGRLARLRGFLAPLAGIALIAAGGYLLTTLLFA